MDPLSLIITSLDVKGTFSNTHIECCRPSASKLRLSFQGVLQAYLGSRL